MVLYFTTIIAGGNHPDSGVQILSSKSCEIMMTPHFPVASVEYRFLWPLRERHGIGYKKGSGSSTPSTSFKDIGLKTQYNEVPLRFLFV